MSFTESELENISNHLRSVGVEIPGDWDNDDIAMVATAVLEALGIAFPEK